VRWVAKTIINAKVDFLLALKDNHKGLCEGVSLWLEQKPEWKGLAAVGRVESTRIIGDKTSIETQYYLCSFTDLERFARVCGSIGASKISSIGCWMCSLGKTAIGPGKIIRRKTGL
jgi:hypothetical protein